MAYYQPLMDGKSMTNTYEEHVFEFRVVFGSSVVSSYYGKDVTFARSTTGVYTLTLPKPYRKWTKLGTGWYRPSGAPLDFRITSMDLDTGSVTFSCMNTSGTAVDPTDGDQVTVAFGVTENLLNDAFSG